MGRLTLVVRLRRHVQSFLSTRSAQNFSRSTLYGNEHHLRRFIGWLEVERPQLDELVAINGQLLDDYALYLATYEDTSGHRLKASTRHGELCSLSSFFQWLKRTGKTLGNPAQNLPFPKVAKKLPRGTLTSKEVTQVMATPDVTTPYGLRARSILEVLYSTAIRNAELRALEVRDLNFTEGLLTVREGKGAKDRVVPMGETAMEWLQRYLEDGRPKLLRSKFEAHVYLSRYGRPFSKTQLLLLMERLGQEAELGKPLTCHGLRHSCATHMLNNGADIRHIQELLGHGSLQSTQVYTHVAVTDLKRVHEQCHPRGKRGEGKPKKR